LNDFHKAIDFSERALKAYRAIEDRREICQTLTRLAVFYSSLGVVSTAIKSLGEALAIAREIADRCEECRIQWNWMVFLDRIGDRPSAIAKAEEALQVFEASNDPAATRIRAKLAEWRASGV
jgi:tetratricopeptide (TPR) repeat protein